MADTDPEAQARGEVTEAFERVQEQRDFFHRRYTQAIIERDAAEQRATAAEQTVKSIAVMLGWANVPPQASLEANLRANRARLEAAEARATQAEQEARRCRLLGEELEQKLVDATAYCSGEWPCEASTAAASLERERNDLQAEVTALRAEHYTDDPDLKPLADQWQRVPGVCGTHGFPFYADKDSVFCAICEWRGTEAERDALQRELTEARGQVATLARIGKAVLDTVMSPPGTSMAAVERNFPCIHDLRLALLDTAAAARAYTDALLAPWQEALREVGLFVQRNSQWTPKWSISTAERLKKVGL